jgi:hypothetical protein
MLVFSVTVLRPLSPSACANDIYLYTGTPLKLKCSDQMPPKIRLGLGRGRGRQKKVNC